MVFSIGILISVQGPTKYIYKYVCEFVLGTNSNIAARFPGSHIVSNILSLYNLNKSGHTPLSKQYQNSRMALSYSNQKDPHRKLTFFKLTRDQVRCIKSGVSPSIDLYTALES